MPAPEHPCMPRTPCYDCTAMAIAFCSSCGNRIEPDDRFCVACGTPVRQTCGSCGAALRPGSRFCASCGAPAPTGPAVPSAPPQEPPPAALPPEERRLVTVLFCDLVGFTPLSESLDPEEVREIQSQYFGRMSEQVERYGGTVEKYAGDAVLALFGAPTAQENDAERAVLCGLGMQEAIGPVAERVRVTWGIHPAIRVGVNTGEVVSGHWSVSGRQDVAVTGDAVNTAARLQSVAEPGEVVVGEETMSLTRRAIRYGERREVVLKGKSGTVPVWPALGLRDDFDARWEGFTTPLVGRERPLRNLSDAWTRARAGEGGLITIVADAGVGKSRLVGEFLTGAAGTGEMTALHARCVSYGRHVSLGLLGDLIRSLVGMEERQSEAAEASIESEIERLIAGCDEEARAETRDVIGALLGLTPRESAVTHATPEIRRQALVRSVERLLRGMAERAPTLLVLEDLHWIDDPSAEVLADVLADIPGLRMLAVTTQRPGWTPPWSEWGWPERMVLRPLDAGDASALAGSILGGAALSPDLERYVADRAGGNPFFVEEMLRALYESGGIEERDGVAHLVPGAAERLPSALTEVLLARLDRLEGQVRGVAQVASVIGRSFAVRLLCQVVGREQTALEMPLRGLQRAEIAFPRGAADIEYVFKHVSIRDVAYGTLVQKRRRELHEQTARAMSALYPSEEYVETIAYHYSKTQAPEAAEWLERAGDRASSVFALENAVEHYAGARERLVAAGREDALARLDEKLGTTYVRWGRPDDALGPLERAAEAYRSGRDLEGAGRVTALLGNLPSSLIPFKERVSRVQTTIDLLSCAGPSRALAALHNQLSYLYWNPGRHADTLREAERAEEIARAVGDQEILGIARMQVGLALSELGRPQESVQAMADAVPLLEETGRLDELWRALILIGEFRKVLGDAAQCRTDTERALAVAERIGNDHMIRFALMNLTQVLIVLGDWEAARESRRRGLGMTAEPSALFMGATVELDLADGTSTSMRAILEEGAKAYRDAGNLYFAQACESELAEIDLHGDTATMDTIRRLEPIAADEGVERAVHLSRLARAYRAAGRLQSAEETSALAVAEAHERDRTLYLPEALRVHGAVLADLDRLVDAEAALQQGLTLARTIPYPYIEAQILCEMARLHATRGDSPSAEATIEEALATFRRLGALYHVQQTQALLDNIRANAMGTGGSTSHTGDP